MKGFISFFWEIIKIVIIALVIVVPIRYFLFQPFFVRGESMEPNFTNGDYLLIDEISYRFGDPQRGEVVVFEYPQNPSLRYIKRIIGLPGETVIIENEKIKIVNQQGEEFLDESAYLEGFSTPGEARTTLNEDEYFVLGDNRFSSSDSRRWGVLPRENIIGKVFLRLWPITVLAKIDTPVYNGI